MALFRPVKEDRRALYLVPRLSPPGDRRYDVLGFVSAGSVSSSSTLQIFPDASHLLWLLNLPASLSAQSFPFSPPATVNGGIQIRSVPSGSARERSLNP